MSEFSENWVACMRGNGLPVPDVEGINEALEFVHKIHSAWENAGGGEELTIVALIAAGAFAGVDEAVLAVLAEAGAVAAVAYLSACIGCIAAVALDDLKGLFAQGELPDFVVAELETQGIDLATA
ncbi:hypothetical protein [Bradyrhizobium liaoningense]|uniref:hypothetical protein n=1 Tax=Bradyrhizobium liaoningense TaxID=43992 RepID=UPI001BACC315|nr:hypothetical protein [Bradyrhizobium liaoningense]MBR0820237.1 hypothetical protein [Bradyrhizobium liaoningense]